MFPISDSIKSRRIPYLNIFLIVVTIYVFIQQLLAPDMDTFIARYALIPSSVHLSQLITLIPFVTAIFLHGGFLHILSNMWFLYIFGDDVEGYLPPLNFLFLYMLAGIVGNIVQYLFMPASSIPMLGASGAVAGILGCYYILFPYSKVKTLVILFFFVTIIDISAPLMLGYWFVLQIISGAASLPMMGSADGGVAFFAHIAGFIIGICFGAIFKSRVEKDQLKFLRYE